MRRLVPLAVPLVALLLSGCLGGCPPQTTLAWEEPDIYAAARGRDDAHEVPPAGRAFAEAEEVVGPGAHALMVREPWPGEAAARGASLRLDFAAGTTATANVPADEDNATARDVFASFLRAYTTADDAQVDAWVDDAWAARAPALVQVMPDGSERVALYEHVVALPDDELDLVSRWDASAATPAGTAIQAGQRSMRVGDATWLFTLPVRGFETGNGVSLRVDSGDRVEARHEGYEEESRAAVAEAMTAEGLPHAGIAQAEHGTMVC